MRRNFYRLFVVLIISTAPGSRCLAQEQSVNPGVNQHYQNADYDVWVSRFEREGRAVYDHRQEIVNKVSLKPGMTVADIGAGTGLFTRLFATAVGPTGTVIAADITPTFVENVLRTSREQGLYNVRGVLNRHNDVSLARHSIDIAYVCDTYHHFEYPEKMLQSIYRALRGDGQLIVIDYEKEEGVSSQWALHHMRADKHTFRREIEQEGFEFVEEWKFHPEKYFMRFKKSRQ